MPSHRSRTRLRPWPSRASAPSWTATRRRGRRRRATSPSGRWQGQAELSREPPLAFESMSEQALADPAIRTNVLPGVHRRRAVRRAPRTELPGDGPLARPLRRAERDQLDRPDHADRPLAMLGMPPTTVSTWIRRLSARRQITRKVNPDDGRSALLEVIGRTLGDRRRAADLQAAARRGRRGARRQAGGCRRRVRRAPGGVEEAVGAENTTKS